MASNPPAQCCTVGVKHEGTPSGADIKIGPQAAYLATPDPAKAHKGAAVLYIPDIIGIWENSKLMADQYAANGYLTVIPDIFNGDPVPLNRPEGFEFSKWFAGGSTGDNPHGPEQIDAIVVRAIEWLKKEHGVTKIASSGYCLGAKYVARHFKDGINVGYFAHPSYVTEDELKGFQGPLSIAAAETDEIFTKPLRDLSEVVLKESGNPYQINLYSGTEHGFSVRADISKKHARFAKEQAFIQAVTWFDTWLLD